MLPAEISHNVGSSLLQQTKDPINRMQFKHDNIMHVLQCIPPCMLAFVQKLNYYINKSQEELIHARYSHQSMNS